MGFESLYEGIMDGAIIGQGGWDGLAFYIDDTDSESSPLGVNRGDFRKTHQSASDGVIYLGARGRARAQRVTDKLNSSVNTLRYSVEHYNGLHQKGSSPVGPNMRDLSDMGVKLLIPSKYSVYPENGLNEMKGGKADGKTVEQIAKKHGVPVAEIEKQLEMGLRVEMEHTDDKDMAREISLDHLTEIADYYSRLKKMEREAGIND